MPLLHPPHTPLAQQFPSQKHPLWHLKPFFLHPQFLPHPFLHEHPLPFFTGLDDPISISWYFEYEILRWSVELYLPSKTKFRTDWRASSIVNWACVLRPCFDVILVIGYWRIYFIALQMLLLWCCWGVMLFTDLECLVVVAVGITILCYIALPMPSCKWKRISAVCRCNSSMCPITSASNIVSSLTNPAVPTLRFSSSVGCFLAVSSSKMFWFRSLKKSSSVTSSFSSSCNSSSEKYPEDSSFLAASVELSSRI